MPPAAALDVLLDDIVVLGDDAASLVLLSDTPRSLVGTLEEIEAGSVTRLDGVAEDEEGLGLPMDIADVVESVAELDVVVIDVLSSALEAEADEDDGSDWEVVIVDADEAL